LTERVVVDMTPLGPRGQNGGAGPVATSLVRHVAMLRPDWELVLLTSGGSHAELAYLDAANVSRVRVDEDSDSVEATRGLRALARGGLQLAPARLRITTTSAIWRLRHGQKNAQLLDTLQPRLLFCPFTVAYYQRSGVPMVAIVHDLQHVAFPEFFSTDQRLFRERQIEEVCRTAARVVCVSEYVRQTMAEHFGMCAGRAIAIPHGLIQDSTAVEAGVLERLGIAGGTYLLYPANFWPHKNHLRLFEALRSSGQKLVCTGAPNTAMYALQRQATEMLGPGRVIFAGYVQNDEYASLLDGCRAVIYPSLYEGFGLPVLEAMAHAKPVLCSRAASLPEVAGEAAGYFDPTDVADIARSIASLDEWVQVERRINLGRARATVFGDATDMARRYVTLFDEVMTGR
jgi:glycosyltransferase involved in cell wall biosynthesis